MKIQQCQLAQRSYFQELIKEMLMVWYMNKRNV